MDNLSRSTPWLVIALTALAPMIWGSTYLVTTEFLPPDRPFIAALLRTLPAGLVLLMLSRQWPKRAQWGRLLCLSLLNIGAFQALLFVAAYRLPGGLAAILGATQPLIVMVLAWQLAGQRPAKTALVASVVGVLGMIALLWVPGAAWDGIGILAAFLGALCMAAGVYFMRHWPSDLPVLAMTGWQLLLGGLMLAPFAWWLDPPLVALSAKQVAGYVYLGVFGTLLAYGLWFRGIAQLPSVAVSSLGLLSPLTAVCLGWWFLGQSLSAVALLGLVMVLGSIWAVQLSAVRK